MVKAVIGTESAGWRFWLTQRGPHVDENAVIQVLCAFLEAHDYIIKQRLHTTQQGVDVIAHHTPSGRRLFVEAKGATSSRAGSPRFDKGFNASQVFDRVAKGVYTAMCLRAEHPDREREEVALAFPDTNAFRSRLSPLRQQLRDIGVSLYLTSPDGRVVLL